jgi:1,4-alpha-glucan branching enzyme
MSIKKYTFLLASVIPLISYSQIITLTPSNANAGDEVTITFNATEGNGELEGAEKVYMHHGVVTDAADGTAWQYVIGNWGQDDGVGEMNRVDGETDLWEITFSPSVREYFGVPQGTPVFRISSVFRSADGGTKGTASPGQYEWGTVEANRDNYIDLNVSSYVAINSPAGMDTYIEAHDSILISATASSEVTNMEILINEGSGYVSQSSVSSGVSIEYYYKSTSSKSISIQVTATINGEEIESVISYNITIRQATIKQTLPAGIRKGINYNPDDNTKVTLVLEAPEKEYAYIVGDFTDWITQDNFQMKQTPDGELFWLEIDSLTPAREYVFQYWVDGGVKIGDPYADKVADPIYDQQIPENVYPDLPEYSKEEYGIATVLQTDQTKYSWSASEDNWARPDPDHLTIYELWVRNITEEHTWSALRDTLSYIKSLGVDAVEIMPFNEFEGNNSWGYNSSYYFAPDKFYGPKDSLKKFIETAHQEGLAVIMDIVLNHAYGQCALVQLYYNAAQARPAANNPWFNEFYAGENIAGIDFNHESPYTEAFIDSVNSYWIGEFHIDGFRFDWTKGFTNYAPGGSNYVYDTSRINNLKRMADAIWRVDPETYVILEHWSPPAEEQVLGEYGMKMWRNKSYDFAPAATGQLGGSFENTGDTTHMVLIASHDERRIGEHMLTEGRSSSDGSYKVSDPLVMFERVKMVAAFLYLFPGPKLIWMFDELGYDIDINMNGRTGVKPLPWGPNGLGYYEDPLRQHIYSAYREILNVRKQIGADNLFSATTNHKYTGNTRRLSYDMDAIDLVLIGNFGLDESAVDPAFTQTGTWFDYFSGETEDISDTDAEITLQAGEWHLFTTERLSDGLPGVVEVFQNPVTITPYPFTKKTEITISFDATKAYTNGTDGLVGASEVFLYSGIVKDDPESYDLTNIVDLNNAMINTEGDIWEITFIPSDYYDIASGEVLYKIGMSFRNEDNSNVGMGFRNNMIYYDVDLSTPILQAIGELDKLIIYPNPSSDEYIYLGQEGITRAEIYDNTGQLLKTYRNNGTTISKLDISDLQTGIFIIRSFDTDDTLYSGKFAKID